MKEKIDCVRFDKNDVKAALLLNIINDLEVVITSDPKDDDYKDKIKNALKSISRIKKKKDELDIELMKELKKYGCKFYWENMGSDAADKHKVAILHYKGIAFQIE